MSHLLLLGVEITAVVGVRRDDDRNTLGDGESVTFQSLDLAGVVREQPQFTDAEIDEDLRPFAVVMSALAAIIASQALISGSYTLVHEAASLDLMPHLQVHYPSDTKGQLYIPLVNNILWVCCMLVVLYFRSGARMENAYGLAITISMLMMTILFTVYIGVLHKKRLGAVLFALVFGAIEIVFFISSLGKFTKGGYVAVILSLVLFLIMLAWYKGTQIERLQAVNLKLRDYLGSIRALQQDSNIPFCSHNVVYLAKGMDDELIDRDILYSIMDKEPKRADAYWLLSVNTMEEPYTMTYHVETYGTDYIYRIQLNLGFKINQKVNVYLRQIVTDLLASGELPRQNKQHSIYGPSDIGSFKFVMIRKLPPTELELSGMTSFLIRLKYTIRRFVGSPVKWYGLETSSVITEYVPLFLPQKQQNDRLTRI